MQVAPPELSSYAESLNQEAKTRYKEKIALIDGIDPFGKVTAGEPYSGVPPVEACDLVSYLVLQTSFITSSQFKARKGTRGIQPVCLRLDQRYPHKKDIWKISYLWSCKPLSLVYFNIHYVFMQS